MKKTALFLFLFFAFDALIYAQSGQSVATKISGVYTSFIRPILIAWLVIQGTITGILANNKVRKESEEGSDAMIGWLKSIVWPVVILGFAEIGNAFYN